MIHKYYHVKGIATRLANDSGVLWRVARINYALGISQTRNDQTSRYGLLSYKEMVHKVDNMGSKSVRDNFNVPKLDGALVIRLLSIVTSGNMSTIAHSILLLFLQLVPKLILQVVLTC